MSVGRICSREVDFATAQENVWQAAERMRQRAVGTLVVLNQAKTPIGILTDRDLVERVIAASVDPSATTVTEVMTREPKTIFEDAPIEEALTLMRSGCLRRLPVVDKDQHLVGIVSLDDVLMLLSEELSVIGQVLQSETPRGAADALGA